ncbi:MAG: Uma2 family endonuclease [Gammaproteobacteria bacterium]|nr:Uma2 family endonuclease [Gammaproteobacteria bacterium]
MAEALVAQVDPVEYPTSDGRPVAETDLHYLRLAGAAYGIRRLLASRDDVYVGSNLLVYDEPGNPRRHLSPDIFVAFGVEAGSRDLYKIWEEQPPAFVLEITSKSTRREDERTKRRRYAQWGVGEYFLYDPRGEWLSPALQGLALAGRRYRRMDEVLLPNGERGLRSDALGICLWLRGAELRLFDPASGRDLRTPEEEGAEREAEAAARAAAEARAGAAEARAGAAEARAGAAEARALSNQRSLLIRQAETRFDAPTAASLAMLLERVASWEDLAQVGDWLVSLRCTAAELLVRVRGLLS